MVQLVLAVLRCRKECSRDVHAQQQQQQEQEEDTEEEEECWQQQQEQEKEKQQQQRQDEEEEDQDEEKAEVDVSAVAAHQLGVICFFRGQATLIRQLLAAGMTLQIDNPFISKM